MKGNGFAFFGRWSDSDSVGCGETPRTPMRTQKYKATARAARCKSIKILRILFIQCSNFVQETPLEFCESGKKYANDFALWRPKVSQATYRVGKVGMKSSVQRIKEFYETPLENGKTRFETWNEEQPVGNSMTPSVTHSNYRTELTSTIDTLLNHDHEKRILSCGAGNAFLEKELSRIYKNILVTDICESALSMAKEKGLATKLLDANNEFDFDANSFDLVFSDGLVGYLFDEQVPITAFLSRCTRVLKSRGLFFIGNDVPADESDIVMLERAQYYYTSPKYLEKNLELAGFVNVQSTCVPYERPQEGSRHRVWAWGTKV